MLLVRRNWYVSKFLFLDGFVDPVAKLAEKVLVSLGCLWRGGTFKKQSPKVLPVLIFADQIADILAGRANRSTNPQCPANGFRARSTPLDPCDG